MLLALSPAIFCIYTTLSVQDFHQKLHDGFFAVVIDVYVAVLKPNLPASNPTHNAVANCPSVPSRRRWESEWQGGHVVNATHIPGLQELSGDVVPSQLLGCTACNIVLYCASGYRSKQAADKLSSLGFTGGIYDGLGIQQWQERHVHVHMHGSR